MVAIGSFAACSNEDIDQLKKDRTELQGKVSTLETTVAALQTAVTAADNAAKAAQTDATKAIADAAAAKTAADAAKVAADAAKAAADAAQGTANEAKTAAAAAQATADAAKADAAAAKAAADAAAALAKSEAAAAEAKAIAAAKTYADGIVADLKAAHEADILAIEGKLTTINGELAALDTKYQGLVDGINEAIEALGLDIETVADALAAYKLEVTAELGILEGQIEALTDRVKALEDVDAENRLTTLETVQAAMDEFFAEWIPEVVGAIEALDGRIDGLATTIDELATSVGGNIATLVETIAANAEAIAANATELGLVKETLAGYETRIAALEGAFASIAEFEEFAALVTERYLALEAALADRFNIDPNDVNGIEGFIEAMFDALAEEWQGDITAALADYAKSADVTTEIANAIDGLRTELTGSIGEAVTNAIFGEFKAAVHEMITSIRFVNENERNWIGVGFNATVAKYNATLGDVTFTEGESLGNADGHLVVQVTPTNVDLSKYLAAGKLFFQDSKEDKTINGPIKIVSVARYDGLLTRAAGDNTGLWQVNLELAKENASALNVIAITEDINTGDPLYIRYAIVAENNVDAKKNDEDVDFVTRFVASDYSANFWQETKNSSYNLTNTPRRAYYNTGAIAGYFPTDRFFAIVGIGETPISYTINDIKNTFDATKEKRWKYVQPATDAYKVGNAAAIESDIATSIIGIDNPDYGTTAPYTMPGDNRATANLPVQEMGKKIVVLVPTPIQDAWYTSEVYGYIVTLDEYATSANLTKWNNAGITGLNVFTPAGSPAEILVPNTDANRTNLHNAEIQFRVKIINYDGTFVDPDGKAFNIKYIAPPVKKTVDLTFTLPTDFNNSQDYDTNYENIKTDFLDKLNATVLQNARYSYTMYVGTGENTSPYLFDAAETTPARDVMAFVKTEGTDVISEVLVPATAVVGEVYSTIDLRDVKSIRMDAINPISWSPNKVYTTKLNIYDNTGTLVAELTVNAKMIVDFTFPALTPTVEFKTNQLTDEGILKIFPTPDAPGTPAIATYSFVNAMFGLVPEISFGLVDTYPVGTPVPTFAGQEVLLDGTDALALVESGEVFTTNALYTFPGTVYDVDLFNAGLAMLPLTAPWEGDDANFGIQFFSYIEQSEFVANDGVKVKLVATQNNTLDITGITVYPDFGLKFPLDRRVAGGHMPYDGYQRIVGNEMVYQVVGDALVDDGMGGYQTTAWTNPTFKTILKTNVNNRENEYYDLYMGQDNNLYFMWKEDVGSSYPQTPVDMTLVFDMVDDFGRTVKKDVELKIRLYPSDVAAAADTEF